MRSNIISKLIVLVFLIVPFFASAQPALANATPIWGIVKTTTGTPIGGVWVKLTDRQAPQDPCCQAESPQTWYVMSSDPDHGNPTYSLDANGNPTALPQGYYYFQSWQTVTSAEKDTKNTTWIDTNKDGANDALVASTTRGDEFGCQENRQNVSVVKPINWYGSFSNTTFMMNNSDGAVRYDLVWTQDTVNLSGYVKAAGVGLNNIPVTVCNNIGTAYTDGNGNFSYTIAKGQSFCLRAPNPLAGYNGPDKSYEYQMPGLTKAQSCSIYGGSYCTYDVDTDNQYNFNYCPVAGTPPACRTAAGSVPDGACGSTSYAANCGTACSGATCCPAYQGDVACTTTPVTLQNGNCTTRVQNPNCTTSCNGSICNSGATNLNLTVGNDVANQAGSFSGTSKVSGMVNDIPNSQAGSNWNNPLKITLTATQGTSANRDYYVVFYDKSATPTPYSSILTNALSSAVPTSNIQSLVSSGRAFVLKYTTGGTYSVWDPATSNWGDVSFKTKATPYRIGTSYSVAPNTGSAWYIKFDKSFGSKAMYTAVQVNDVNNLPAFNANITPQ